MGLLEKLFKKKTVDKDVVTFEEGYAQFLKDGKYNEDAYYSMINLFCKTNGEYLENKHLEIAKNVNQNNLTKKFEIANSEFDQAYFDRIHHNLKEIGYSNLEFKIEKDVIDKLREFALTSKSQTYHQSEFHENDFENPTAAAYYLDYNEIVSNKYVQDIMTNPVIINVVRNYFGCEPIFDYAALWITPKFSDKPAEKEAQAYHFDLDRIKWLKLFIYLDDVTDLQGPHYFVEGTHRVGEKPQYLLDRGYVRIPDNEIEENYDPSRIKKVTGEAGSIFFGDTKCWHKGSVVKEGKRIVLQLEFTSSVFGGNVPKSTITNPSSEFLAFYKKNKYFCSNLIIN